jgi:trimethylamine--corrinoid protein Co-methyltransferase
MSSAWSAARSSRPRPMTRRQGDAGMTCADKPRATPTARRGAGRADGRALPRRPNYRSCATPSRHVGLFRRRGREHARHGAAHARRAGHAVLLPEARRISCRAGARSTARWSISAARSSRRRWPPRPGSSIAAPGSAGPRRRAGAWRARLSARRGRAPCHRSQTRAPPRLGAISANTRADRHHFDVFQMMPPRWSRRTCPLHLRHYFTTRGQMDADRQVPLPLFARHAAGARQFRDAADFAGPRTRSSAGRPCLHDHQHQLAPHLDIPMAQGLIDFARARAAVHRHALHADGGDGADHGGGRDHAVSHAECLAAITLTQLAPGAPVCYGTFTSNVDMKSGAPAFGTPDAFPGLAGGGADGADARACPGARRPGRPPTYNDVQAANENQLGLWGCLLAGATVIIHSAGWLEGGSDGLLREDHHRRRGAEHGGRALRRQPGRARRDRFCQRAVPCRAAGHFFAAPQTMERYTTEFYQPIVHDYANFGTWTERGALDANEPRDRRSGRRSWRAMHRR